MTTEAATGSKLSATWNRVLDDMDDTLAAAIADAQRHEDALAVDAPTTPPAWPGEMQRPPERLTAAAGQAADTVAAVVAALEAAADELETWLATARGQSGKLTQPPPDSVS